MIFFDYDFKTASRPFMHSVRTTHVLDVHAKFGSIALSVQDNEDTFKIISNNEPSLIVY